ncbi:MAG TPA: hypothetical protein PK401_02810 [Bacteroidales bacterium]|nr:hypothetical protein [Bacteroidales bacterium]
MTRTCSLFFFLILSALPVFKNSLFAQDPIPVISYYQEQSGVFSPLFNGKIPPEYRMLHDGTYFLESEDYYTGTVVYNGKRYVDIQLNLNAHLDELYVKIPQYNSNTILLKAHVASFTLDNMDFLHIVRDLFPMTPETGYYRVLFSGEKIMVLKKTKKLMNSATPDVEMTVTHVFNESTSYYIVRDGIFHPVKRKGSVLRVLRDKRKELNRHIRDNKLGFGKEDRDVSLASCAARYEQEAL